MVNSYAKIGDIQLSQGFLSEAECQHIREVAEPRAAPRDQRPQDTEDSEADGLDRQ